MQILPSPELNNPLRLARSAILNGVPVPQTVQAQLEAQGIDVGALQTRLMESMEFKR